MVRHNAVITLQFTNTPTEHPAQMSSINLYECALFLMSNYRALIDIPEQSLRFNVMSNHILTLRTLSRINAGLDISCLLSPDDPEHVAIVERLFLGCVRTVIPRPVLQLPSVTVLSDAEAKALRESLPVHLQPMVDFVMAFCYAMAMDNRVVGIRFCVHPSSPTQSWCPPCARIPTSPSFHRSLHTGLCPRPPPPTPPSPASSPPFPTPRSCTPRPPS